MNKTFIAAHLLTTLAAATLATGCTLQGKSMFGSTMPDSTMPDSTMPSAPVETVTAADSSGPAATPAATPASDAEPDLEELKMNILRAQHAPNATTAKACIDSYDKAIASGVSPSYRTRYQNEENTIAYFKQTHCVDGVANAAKADDERAAPYREKLKNDKLKMALASEYAVAGGDYSMNPAKLAAAPVWFDSVGAPSNEQQACDSGGARNIVRRYQFDGKHVLLKRTEREYCGEPPVSAYR